VVQLFLYCIVVVGDFLVWNLKSDEEPIWIWVGVVYGAVLVFQGLVYAFLQWCGIRGKTDKKTEKQRKFLDLVSKLSPLVNKRVTPVNSPPLSYSSFSTSSTLSSTLSSSTISCPSVDDFFDAPIGSENTDFSPNPEKFPEVTEKNAEFEEFEESIGSYVTVSNPIYSAFPMLRTRDEQSTLMALRSSPPQRVYTILVEDNPRISVRSVNSEMTQF